MRGTWFFNLLTMIGVMVALAVAAPPAMAQRGVAGAALAVCVAPATAATNAMAILTRPATALDCATPQSKFGPGDFWVRAAPFSQSGPANIRIASVWQDRVTLHAAYADGHTLAIATDAARATRQLQLGAIIEWSLPPRAAPLIGLAWHVEGSANLRGIVLGARIATPAQSARANLTMGAVYAGFVGLCVALLVYNLALWGALRHRFQLAYCAMVLGLMVYGISSSGALAWAMPDIANNDRLRINYVALAVAATAALIFARTFFEPRVFAGWLARASNAICAAIMTSAIVFAVFAPWQIALLDRVYALTFLAQIAIVGPILWRAWATRSNYLWMFAIAWAAPIVLACLRVANSLQAVRWSFWLDHSTIVMMTVEALLSSLAIAYRIRLLANERDEARVQEIAARLLADTDALTGLLNRRAFLRNAIGRADEQRLLLIDIDHFKRVNETIGHDGGDEVLRVVARTLRASTGTNALVARVGGEEFAIIVPVTEPIEAEDILANLRSTRMPFDLAVTASIGICAGPLVRETDWKELYRSADRALFDAKAAGRDRSRVGNRPTFGIAAAA